MRTLIIIFMGLVIVALILRLTRPTMRIVLGGVFTVGGLIAILLNLKTGLSHGYTLAEELPIHLVLFTIPVAAYWLYVRFKH